MSKRCLRCGRPIDEDKEILALFLGGPLNGEVRPHEGGYRYRHTMMLEEGLEYYNYLPKEIRLSNGDMFMIMLPELVSVWRTSK